MRRMAYSTTGFSLYSDGRGIVSVWGYGPRNMAMLSSLRSIAIVASLRDDSAISTTRPDRIQPRERLALFTGEEATEYSSIGCGNGQQGKWFKVGVAARKDYCTMRTQEYCLRWHKTFMSINIKARVALLAYLLRSIFHEISLLASSLARCPARPLPP